MKLHSPFFTRTGTGGVLASCEDVGRSPPSLSVLSSKSVLQLLVPGEEGDANVTGDLFGSFFTNNCSDSTAAL